MAYSQGFVSREGPVEMAGVECGELIEKEVKEAWWLGNSGERMNMGKLCYFLQPTEFHYVRTLVVKTFFIISQSLAL